MKAIQRYNEDTGKWEYIFNYPMSANEANEELKKQRAWAEEDNSGKKYRVINVNLK